MTTRTIRVEVAYATTQDARLLALDLPEGSTARAAISTSGLLAAFPDIDLAHCRIGIYSRPCTLDTVLRDRDRVEIYRPLLADPKAVRRARVAAGLSMKKRPPNAG